VTHGKSHVSPALIGAHLGNQRGDVRLPRLVFAAQSRQMREWPIIIEPEPPLTAQISEMIGDHLFKRSRAGGGSAVEAWQELGNGGVGTLRSERHAPA